MLRVPRPSAFTLMALRHSLRHPIQSLLLVLGVALGVAMIIAIDLANSSASQAFSLSTESIAGKATHQIVAAGERVPTSLYESLRVEADQRDIAPVVTGLAQLEEADDLPLQILGVDPFAEAPFRNYLSGGDEGLSLEMLARILLEPETVVLSASLGQRFNLQAGDTLSLRIDGQQRLVTLVGFVDPADALSRRALDGLILTDISTAQELLDQTGYLSHIDLILETPEDVTALRSLLPPGVALQRTELRNETLDQLTAAFELNLSALSLLGLVVGMFLIYNTISFSVVQRRPVLGTLRCLGVSRQEVFALVLVEALILSAIGTLIGLGLGILLGRGLVGLVSQTVNDLFFTLTVQGVSLSAWTVYKGVAVGLGAGLLAAFVPALEATTIPPVSTLKRSSSESRVQALIPRLSVVGVGVVLLSVVALQLPNQNLVLSFGALFLIIIGIALLTPGAMQILIRLVQPLARPLGLIGLMAPRDILRALSRTSVTVAALMIAVSVIIGVSVMVSSFRSTVEDWLNDILTADIFISPAEQTAQPGLTLPPEFVRQIQGDSSVTGIGLARVVSVLSPDLGTISLNAFSPSPSDRERNYLWLDGSLDEALAALANEEAVMVTEVFARRHGLSVRQPGEITLLTPDGEQRFNVVGVFQDYANPQGFVLMNLATYQNLWDDESISNLSLYLADTADVEAQVTALQDAYAGLYTLNIVSNRSIKAQALEIFDRTFTITAALRLLATIVAFIGVLSALMSLQLERTRELGTLRATGMSVRQVWQLTLLETGLMGLVAGLIAIPTGIVLALVLIFVINLRSFGWSMQMQLDPVVFVMAMAVSMVAALLAGIYPAFRLSRLQIAAALRDE